MIINCLHGRAVRFCLAGGLLAALGATQSRAQPVEDISAAPWLQVEVIVFRNLDTTLAGDEKWPENPAPGYPEDLRILRDPAPLAAEPAPPAGVAMPTEELPFVKLAPGQRSLDAAAARLAASPVYRLLGHYAWRQPAPASGNRSSVLITGGAAHGEHFELEGSLTVARSHFLHVDTRLWLNEFGPSTGDTPSAAADLPAVPQPLAEQFEPATIEMIATQPLRSTRTVLLEQSRRVQLGEVHYIDHPLFAVLLKLEPYDPQGASTQAEDQPTSP